MDPITQQMLGGSAGGGPAIYVEDVFSTWAYTGNNSSQTITNGIDLSGKGGMVWIRGRFAGADSNLYDTNRGANTLIQSNTTNPSQTQASALTSFNSNGFSVGSYSAVNSNAKYVSWSLRKAEKFFDVVTYQGTGSARTVAHNLGSAPGCIIIKHLGSSSYDWEVYHRTAGATDSGYLNTVNNFVGSPNSWNNTAPTSSVFTLGSYNGVNQPGSNYVAYLFAHDAGGFGDSGADSVISCGSYVGTGGTPGPTVNLGWEPQWIMIKARNAAGEWNILDNIRNLTVGNDAELNANNSANETTSNYVNLTPTGFQVITNADASYNSNGVTYAYVAIRRPMKRPTNGATVFNGISYSGTSTGDREFTGVGFAPDIVIYKCRTLAGLDTVVHDRLRGTNALYMSTNGGESNNAFGAAIFGNDGYTQGSSGQSYWNASGRTHFNWLMRRAPGFFDVTTYTGTGSAATVNHNLGVAPELMLVKGRTLGSDWGVYHASLTAGGSPQRSGIYLNNTLAEFDASTVWWNATAPTTSVLSVGTSNIVNQLSQPYVAYLFATCPGVSKVGKYTGSGSNTQVDCGFTNGARFVMVKRSDSSGGWYVWDSIRGITGSTDPYMQMNTTAAEVTSTDYIAPYSAGFTITSSAPADLNAAGGSFIYLAIA